MRRSIAILLWLFVVGPTYAESPPWQILASPEKPFTFINHKEQIDGFAIELVNDIQQKLDTQYPVYNYPWARLFKLLSDQKNVVALTVARTPEREDKFHWITSIARSIHGLYALQKNNVRVSDLEAVKQIGSIGVLRGDIRETVLRHAGVTDIVAYNSWDQVVGALLKGRVKAIFYSSSGVNYACPPNKSGCEQIENIFIYKVVTTYVAISKNGTDEQLVNRWKQAAEDYKHDKAFVYLTQKWIKYYQQYENMDLYLDNGAINVWKDPNLTAEIKAQSSFVN
ncbi:substrate-binding periplasmic protein [Neptunicella sp. SCSIO 80796]|uniref:substrate-binding periplasmic protein n=1 Tax=Neptunicella plasticusilytica TaxID=3117012 RepID=UPI003A4D3187